MGVLFVVGVMNLVWVGVLTVFVLIEKIGPTGVRLARTGGAIMVVLGVIMVSTGCSQALAGAAVLFLAIRLVG